MTAIWGPLGWMTLHSVATSYPEIPTASEKALMNSWLDMFRDTITCAYCRGHFTELLGKYRSLFPNMLESRQEFAMFSFRAHNAVNRRLNKPVYATLADCMDRLKKNVAVRSAKDYRISYVNHITRHWRTEQDITGVMALKKIGEMKKIEIEYVGPRDTNFNVTLRPDVVILPSDALEKAREAGDGRPRPLPTTNVGLRFTGGVFRLQK